MPDRNSQNKQKVQYIYKFNSIPKQKKYNKIKQIKYNTI